MAKQLTIVAIGWLTLALCMPGCSDTADYSRWDIDDAAAQARVDPTLCRGLADADSEGPMVRRETPTHWRIQYPAFSKACGVYQLTADLDAAAEDLSGYNYEVAVCNRCDSAQTIDFLRGYGHHSLGPPEHLSVPEHPRVQAVPIMFQQGGPVVRHSSVSDRLDLYEQCSTPTGIGGETTGQYTWPSYGSLYEVTIGSGEVLRQSRPVRLDVDPQDFDLDNGLITFERTRIYWPKLHASQADITGVQAASKPEICINLAVDPSQNRPTMSGWPWDFPYRVENKYSQQDVGSMALPAGLVQVLRDR